MQLTPGDKLGPYEITAPIGRGGMGEVWKARDTRLERSVAIKVSAKKFNNRFKRETEAIASLNHPNICTLYDVGPDYLVMEFIDGTPLPSAVPVKEALRLGIQIAGAIDHAHRRGVIHRDLKPQNILVTKAGVKVLDFGLAKLTREHLSESQPLGPQEATLTQHGVVLGTPQYMAPEQVEGKEADGRTDIFAFGLLLYQMLTGRHAFEGKTQAQVMAAIIASEPAPLGELQPHTPPALAHLVKTCLAKDPDERRQSMHDVMLELQWIAESGSQVGMTPVTVERGRPRPRISWVIAGVMTAAAVALAVVHFREQPPRADAMHFEFAIPDKTTVDLFDTVAISPDGRKIAFTGRKLGGQSALWIRPVDSLEIREVVAAGYVSNPFWSPDSRQLAFFSDGRLSRIDPGGGEAIALCEVQTPRGGSWGPDGSILFSDDGKIRRVAASGGDVVTVLESKENHLWPQFLPNGKRFLYYTPAAEAGKSGVHARSLHGNDSRLVISSSSRAVVAGEFLLYGRQQTLLAQPFDALKAEVSGESFPVTPSLRYPWAFSVSASGSVAYVRGASVAASVLHSYDRSGRRQASHGEPQLFINFALSPDERRVAIESVARSGVRNVDILQIDLPTGIMSKITSAPASETDPVWSPDGSEILFRSNRDPQIQIYRKVVGGGSEQAVVRGPAMQFPAVWTKDGSIVLLNQNGRTFSRVPLAGGKPESLLETEYSKDEPRLSPDGKWISYQTNESGRWEVYVAAFPGFTGRRQVSSRGGFQSSWRKDGRELYYLTSDGQMMAVEVKVGTAIETGVPKALFQTQLQPDQRYSQFAATGDGQKFYVLEPVDSRTDSITVLVNALRRK